MADNPKLDGNGEPISVENPPMPYTTAGKANTLEQSELQPKPGQSFTPNLQQVPDSLVPDTGVAHVFGPQQSAVDPFAAGLDVDFKPINRAENRAVTQTGEQASGPHPYLQDHPPEDGKLVRPPPDSESEQVSGPSAASHHTPA